MIESTSITEPYPDTPAAPVYVPAAHLDEILGCHPRTVLRLAARGVIPPPVTLGGLRRWHLPSFLRALTPKPEIHE